MGVYVDENPGGLDLARVLPLLPPARREHALRYRNELDRRLSAAVYLLLKEGLKEEYGIDEDPVLAVGPTGKPYLAHHPGIHFSFSHCPKAAACAIGADPVGIDVEAVASVDWEVARRVLSAKEREEVSTSPQPDVAFARFWTKKEALLKSRGEPLDESRLPDLLTGCAADIWTHVRPEYVVSVAGLPRHSL